MAQPPRPFNPRSLQPFATAAIRVQLGPETLVRRYTALVPLEEYFLALQKELCEDLVEGVILVQRQDVTIL